ncbi:hypothetical protein CMZ82_04805 [Lysobacteraceae bacterium NML93-0792]|nr:hypothetical protein CMZ82_04805 [Xanthomonadaceae bacterium NML93-0792]PBS17119.1 hypothetical protein CMZ81_02585 [Xanthomonadaceae bacterium NML93-0793]PBS19627.1 hypothetical protein CMZ80_05070 [Xanthomonadaceae bacterium NML93-0831]
MADDRVVCVECGAMILMATAARNAGLCMPCKNGTREQMAKNRAIGERDKARRESPGSKHWKWLVSEVSRAGGSLDTLSPANRLYFAASCLGGEVFNGGFGQYFHNSSSNHHAVVVESLEAMRAFRTLSLVREAASVAFVDAEVPRDWFARRKLLWDVSDSRRRELEEKLDAIDRVFYEREHEDEFIECVERFAESHRLYEGF